MSAYIGLHGERHTFSKETHHQHPSRVQWCSSKTISSWTNWQIYPRYYRWIPKYIGKITSLICVFLSFNSTIENVELAGKAICQEASKKIASGDVILTYGYSSLLLQILLKAFNEDNKKFRVVVLDSSPRSEGLQLLRRLVAAKIPSVYMLISGASYIMPEVCTNQFTSSIPTTIACIALIIR